MVEQEDLSGEEVPVIEMGQWFRPFEGYEDMKSRRLAGSSASVEFAYRDFSISKLRKPVSAVLGYREHGTGFPSLVVTASGETPVPSGEFLEAQRRTSARLLTPFFISTVDLYGLSVELQFSEEGRIFTNPFVPYTPNGNSLTPFGNWRSLGSETGQQRVSLYFPEREYNFNQINVRVIPTPVETIEGGRV